MSITYLGQHRANVAEERVRNRLDRLRRHDVPALVAVGVWWAGLVDWGRIPWRNARLAVIEWWSRWAVPTDVPGIPKCVTCRHKEHRACGYFLNDPACGCYCTAAQTHRRELADIERWANAWPSP